MKIKELISIVQGQCEVNKRRQEYKVGKIVIDSRMVKKGDVFIALVGKTKDGHDYISEVLKKKPSCIIVNKTFKVKTSIPVIHVSDTLEALHSIAKYKRKHFDGVVIAVTGSCGKTSTKEMISHLLEIKYRVLKNEKNYNNHIGVPLTLLKLTNDYDILVIECGTNHPGEMEVLGRLVKPDMVVVTNIGTSHIGNFKNKRAILKEKMKLIDTMEDGVLIVNGDDPLLRKVKHSGIEIYQTFNRHSVIHLKTIYCLFEYSLITFEYMNQVYEIELSIPGKGMVDNFLLALECALFLNVDINQIINHIPTLELDTGRLEKKVLSHGNILINDCYNASFESMISLLSILKPLPQHKVFILGDMKELGKHSDRYHRKVVKLLKKIKNKEVMLVGEAFKKVVPSDDPFFWFSSNDDLLKALSTKKYQDTIIAIKGAHSMNLEEISTYFKDCV